MSVYEDGLEDTLKTTYYLDLKKKLAGSATADGTDKYYRLSQYGEGEFGQNLDVHHENFRDLMHNENIKLSSLGIGSYMGEPTDKVDFELYNAIKTSVMSGGVNHIDTAPNYRYMKSERTIGRALAVLDQKYDIKRESLFVASKVGYIPEDGDNLITISEMAKSLVQDHGVPEESI